MKICYNIFKLMLIRPAVYNGEEFEIKASFDEASLYRTDIATTAAIHTEAGDTASIRGKICFEDENSLCEYITIYVSENTLTEFITKYGFNKISATVKMKVKFIYAVHSPNDFCGDERKEEIIACQLIEILPEQNTDIEIENTMSAEMQDYFADGMK